MDLHIFVMNGCGHCMKVKEDYANGKFADKFNNKFDKIEIHEYGDAITKQHNINGFPTFIVKKGGKEIDKEEGYGSIDDLDKRFDNNLLSSKQTGGNIDYKKKYYQYKTKYLKLKAKSNK